MLLVEVFFAVFFICLSSGCAMVGDDLGEHEGGGVCYVG